MDAYQSHVANDIKSPRARAPIEGNARASSENPAANFVVRAESLPSTQSLLNTRVCDRGRRKTHSRRDVIHSRTFYSETQGQLYNAMQQSARDKHINRQIPRKIS